MTEVGIFKMEYRTISLFKTKTSNEAECLNLEYMMKNCYKKDIVL